MGCFSPSNSIFPAMFLLAKLLLCSDLELDCLSFLFFVLFAPLLLNAQYPWLSSDPINNVKSNVSLCYTSAKHV